MQNDINLIFNSIYSGKTNGKPKNSSKPATLTKDSTNFHKITENNIISTSGEQPLLIYKKKEPKISHSFDYKMTKKNSDKNIYISDGGLKKKNAKFNSGYNYANNNQKSNKMKSLRTYLESININKILKSTGTNTKKHKKANINNSKKNIPTEEHIFYKTVRGSSNRPVFQNKYFNNEKNNYHTKEGFGIRYKISNNNKNNKNQKNLKNYEESKKTEENRNVLIDSLIKGVIKNNYFLIDNNENKIDPKEILSNKKKEYLQRNGIGVSDVNLNENEENKNEKDEIDKMSKTENNFVPAKLKNYIKLSNGISPKKNRLYMTLNDETYFLNNNQLKNRKPIVDQFEYIKKINKHKRLHTYEISQKERDKIFLKKFKNDLKNNQLLNDSFRHKNKIGNNTKNKMETKNKDKKSNSSEKNYLQKKNKKDYPSSLTDVNNDEYPYAHKLSYRTPKEINNFVKEKKLQTKQKVNNDELIKNKKLFVKFKNLYNLNFRRININMNKTMLNQDKYLPKEKIKNKRNENTYSTGFNSTNKSIKIRQNDSRFRKRKEPNEFYVGNESFINNNSTLIDPNEYYLNVLESQQLLVNSELNKIENESDEETEEFSDGNEENNDNQDSKEEINTSKEQIQKIIKKESKRGKTNNININNIKKNFNIQQRNNIKANNFNKNERTIINPRNIIKLIEVLKIIIQRRVFINIYKTYINETIFQHYNIAFIYFIAICKYRAFRKIEEYSNYKAYNHTFRKLLFPFIRRAFKTFIHHCYLKQKIGFLVLSINKFYKFKLLKNIYIYSKILEGQEEEKQFELVILKIVKGILKPHLKIIFDKLKKYQKEKHLPVKIKKEDIKAENKIIPPNDIKSENIKQKEKEDEKNEERYKKINKRYLEYSPTHNNKARSYLYESFNDESSYSIRPNSLDNDKWHQIQTKIQLGRYMLLNNELEDGDIDNFVDYNKYKNFNYPQNNSFSSKKSEKSSNISNEKKKEIKRKNVDKNNNLKENKDDKGIKIDNLKYENVKDKDKQKKNENIIIENYNQNKIINEEPKIKNNININKDENKDNINININNNQNINDKEKKIVNNKEIEKKADKNNKNINNNKINNKSKAIENKDDINNNNIIDKIENKNQIKKDNDNNKEKDIEYNKDIIVINKKEKKENKKKETNKKENKIKEEKDEEEDEKIVNNVNNDIQIKSKTEEIQTNIKNKNEIVNAPKKEKKIISKEEIQEKDLKNKTKSEIDISAERDEDDNIDWEYSLNNDKNSLQNSANSENFKKQKSKQENIEINNNSNIKEGNKSNIKIENKEKPIEEKKIEKEEKIIKNLNLIDDDEKSEEFDKKEKEFKKDINKEKKKTLKKDKKHLNQSDDEYLDEFEDIDFDINSESEQNSEKNIKNNKLKIEKENGIEKEKKIENNKDKIDKSRNNNLEQNIKNIKINENKKNNKSSSSELSKDIIIKIKNKEQFSNDLTDEILKSIINSEIKSNKIKLIPTKSFKYEFFTNLSNSQSLSASIGSSGNNINKDLALLNINQLSLSDDLSSLNDSIMSSYTAFSVFNRTIKDKKKEHSLQLYYKKIAPILIKLIKEEIYIKYPRIYENISMPLKNQSLQLMMSLSLQDADMLRDNYKCVLMKESIKNIIDKEKILKKFEPINKLIRSKDNLTSDNFYDNILNECLIDTAIELINKERFYGENGDPLVWSSRTHELVFKYKKDDPKKLAKYVCNNLLKTLHMRIGLLTENYDYLNAEQINNERDKRLIKNIRNELDEDEYQWRNLEMEETQLKVEIAELIIDQLYNENIEILEHIQYSRNRPDLYQYKSIYACEEIPKLSFQQTTTENANKDKDDGDEVVNV